mgnify:CR=1 FL=1
MKQLYGTDSMGETAENVAKDHKINRADQDAFAAASQAKTAAAQEDGRLAEEISPVTIPQRQGDVIVVDRDEHPRAGTSVEKLSGLKAAFREGGTVTAGNSSGVNDGACALLIASEHAVKAYGLAPRARILGMASAGVPPRVMGIGPVPASEKLLSKLGFTTDDLDVIELNEAFAAQACAVSKDLGFDSEIVNPNGGAIALGHPVGATGSIIMTKLIYELKRTGGRYGLATMCIGGGQGIAIGLEMV